MRTFQFLLGICFILLVITCTKHNDQEPFIEEEPEIEKNPVVDTVIPEDSVIYIDTCLVDTCYTCHMQEGFYSYYNELINAYNQGCDRCFSEILFQISKTYVPDTDIPDSIKMVYDVYKEFYSPWDLSRIADSEFGNDIFKGIRFYLMQESISYDYNFRYNGNSTMYTIDNFNPTIANDTISLIDANKGVQDMLGCFIGTGFLPINYDSIYVPPYSYSEINARYGYLNKFIRIFQSHWDEGFHYETHPEVFVISFNETKDSAQVHFRLGYEGGEVILGKDSIKWNIVDHYMTWIEK